MVNFAHIGIPKNIFSLFSLENPGQYYIKNCAPKLINLLNDIMILISISFFGL